MTEEDFRKFYRLGVMKYYDCGGKYECDKAQQMIQNCGEKYIATWKNDGEFGRCLVDENHNVTFQSRNISKVTGEYGDKTASLPHLVEEAAKLPAQTVLLGELCFDDFTTTSKDVGSILRCLPQKAIARQAKGPKLKFKVFDCLAANGESYLNQPYEKRFEVARHLVEIYCGDNIVFCRYTFDSFEDYVADILRQGGEGIVIHSKSYIYAPDKRPAWSTLKVKRTTGELEVLVLDTIEPKKAYEGKESATWQYIIDGECVTKPYFMGWKNGIVVDVGGNRVNVTSGLTDDDREWLASDAAKQMIENKELWAVISGMELTDSSVRHPRLIRLRTEK